MSVSVIIATFGDYSIWEGLADRAERSVNDAEIVRFHGKTLASARNSGAHQASGDRLVFLDGDDELERDFVSKITETEDVLQPMARYVRDGVPGEAFYHMPAPDLIIGNHIIVGAPVKKDIFIESGGFDEYDSMEDWALWLKLRSMGATFGVTSGVYLINLRSNSRNSTVTESTIEKIRKRFQ